MLIKKISLLFVLTALISLCGCSSIMRPPSAAAFMGNYGMDNATINVGLALYGGDLIDNDELPREVREQTEYEIDQAEWFFDGLFNVSWKKGFLLYGFGLETFTPFFQLGFVSPYFGISTWSSIYSPLNVEALYEEKHYWEGVSLGAMLIQQVPIGECVNLGVFEHFSRNGSEWKRTERLGGLFARDIFSESRPIFYREVGGGAYVSYRSKESVFSLEFRYGRDVDYYRNRFSLLFSASFSRKDTEGTNS